MMGTEVDPAMALERLSALKGRFAWLSKIEDDCVLRVNIGEPSLLVRDELIQNSVSANSSSKRRLVRPIGEWRLFVGTGLWEIIQDDASLQRRRLQDERSPTHEQRWLSNLDGQKITDVTYESNLREWRFHFDLGARLHIRADPTERGGTLSEQWTVFSARGGRISCSWDGHLAFKGTF